MSQKLILTTLKNEGAFLLDWVAYNLALGFDHFLIFTNDCADGTDDMAEVLQDLGLATHVLNDAFAKQGPQWSALNHGVTKNIALNDWVFVSDVDEYLSVHAGDGSLDALIASASECEAISIPWRFFGSAGLVEYEDKSVRHCFTRTSPYPLNYPRQALMAKTLFQKTQAVQKPGIHAPRLKKGAALRWFGANGQHLQNFNPKTPILMGPNEGIRLAQINHYALRSAKSFLVKSERGLPNRKSANIDLTYWMRRNFNAVEDCSVARMEDATADYLAKLLSDERLARLHASACKWHQEAAERIAKTRHGLELLSGILMAGDSRIVSQEEAVAIYQYHRALHAAEQGS